MKSLNLLIAKLALFVGASLLASGCTSTLSPPKTSLKQNIVTIPVDHFGFSAISNPQTAGISFSVTITAYDANNDVITALNSEIRFTDVTGTLSPNNVPFTNGVATVNFIITRATASTSIFSVPGTGIPLSQSNTFQVMHGNFSRYVCTSTLAQQTVATPFAAAFEAQDSYGNTVLSLNTPANITFGSTAGGVLAPVGAQAFSAGLLNVTGIQLSVAGNQTISIYDPIRNAMATCNAFDVLPGPLDHFTMVTPNPITACQNTAITIRAFDAYNNLKTNLNSSFNLTDANTSLTLNSPAVFSAGIALMNIRIGLAAADTLSVQSIPAGVTLNQAVNVVHGPLATVSFNTLTNPEACVNNSVTVFAKDGCGNTVTSHNEPFTIDVISGGITTTPNSGVFAGGVASFANFTFSAVASGVQMRGSTALTTGGTFTGTSNVFNVVTPTAPPTFQFDTVSSSITACQNFSVTVRAKDACGVTVTGGAIATATVNITETGGATVTPNSAALVGGVATFNAQLPLVGNSLTLHADWTSITGTSNPFNSVVTTTPSQIAIDAIAAQMACVPFAVVARAQDACGNLVTSYNGAAAWSASLGALSPATPTAFVNGLLTETTARISSVVTGTTITVSTTTPALNRVSNAFNVTTNTNPYSFILALSPAYLLQDGSETIAVNVTDVEDACNNTAVDGTLASISFAGTTNLVSVGGATNTTTGGTTSFSVRGNNNGQTGLFQVRVTIGGNTEQEDVSLETFNDFAPVAAQSYKLATTSGSTPTVGDLTGGTAYSAGEVTQVTNSDTTRLIDIRSPQAGWKNLESDSYGGFGSNRVNNASNGLYGMGMVYATNIRKFVVFGGLDFESPGPNYRSNTYLFDPTTKIWSEVSPQQFCSASIFRSVTGYSTCAGTTPPARSHHGMAYLPSTGKVVVFGGNSASGALNDTWEFDPQTLTWAQMSGTMPPRRYSGLLTYNPANAAAYLFGGTDGTNHYNDIWYYSASSQTWNSPPVGGARPSPRRGIAGGITSAGRLFIFGGRDQFNVFNDTWAFSSSSNNWIQMIQSGCTNNCTLSPSVRSFSSGVLIASRNELYLFGGISNLGTALSDTWVLNTVSGSEEWTDASAGSRPSATAESGVLAMHATTQEIYFAGGLNSLSAARTDLWKLSPITKLWSQFYQSSVTGCSATQAGSERCSPFPFPRTAPGFSFLSGNYVIPAPVYVFGGAVSSEFRTDAFAFDPISYASGWVSKNVTPSLSGGHNGFRANQAVYLASTDKLLKWGGTWNSGCRSNDTWEYTPSTDVWAQTVGTAGCGCAASCATSPPQPAADHYGLAYEATSDRAVLAGVDAQTWEFNPSAHTWAAFASNIGARSGFRMAPIGSGRVLAFGGRSGGGTTLGDTWEYDTATHTWTQYMPATNPGARTNYALAYSPLSNRAYLFGGLDGSSNQYNDLWEYNPAAHTWVSLSGACTHECTGPVFRYEAGFEFSKQDGCLHLFGGTSAPASTPVYLMDRWRYCPVGNADGTTLYHMNTFDVSSMAAQLGASQRIQLFFTGAGNGEASGTPQFQVSASGYSVGGGLWQNAGVANSNTEITNVFTLTTAVADMVDGSNRVRVLLSPLNPSGTSTGSALMINQSRLRIRYR